MSYIEKFFRAAFASRKEASALFPAIVAAIYGVLVGYSLLRHDMWRDEVHCWLMGKTAGGLLDILTGNRRYDGHPFLWYYFLHLLSRIWNDVRMLQVAAFGLSTGAAFLWMRYSCLPRIWRVLCLGSYFIVYEYSVLSRGYTLGLFLLALFFALYDSRRQRFVALSLVLSALAATSVYGFILACSLAVPTFLAPLWLLRTDGERWRLRLVVPPRWIPAILILGASLLLVAVTTLPPKDAWFATTWKLDIDENGLRSAMERYWMGMVPIPAWERLDFWNTNWLIWSSPWRQWATWFALAILISCLVVFMRRPLVGITYVIGFLLMEFIQHAKYTGSARHHGHFFLLFVACVWLYAQQEPRRRIPAAVQGLFALVLVPQLIGGYIATAHGWTSSFSSSRQTAEFIQSHGLSGRPILGMHDGPVSAVTGYLDVPMLSMNTGETVWAVVWHNRRNNNFSAADVIEAARGLQQKTGRDPIIVSDIYYSSLEDEELVIEQVFQGGHAVIGDERFIVYTVRRR